MCGGSSFKTQNVTNVAWLNFLCLAPVGDIRGSEAVEDQSIIFDAYIESVV